MFFLIVCVNNKIELSSKLLSSAQNIKFSFRKYKKINISKYDITLPNVHYTQRKAYIIDCPGNITECKQKGFFAKNKANMPTSKKNPELPVRIVSDKETFFLSKS